MLIKRDTFIPNDICSSLRFSLTQSDILQSNPNCPLSQKIFSDIDASATGSLDFLSEHNVVESILSSILILRFLSFCSVVVK